MMVGTMYFSESLEWNELNTHGKRPKPRYIVRASSTHVHVCIAEL